MYVYCNFYCSPAKKHGSDPLTFLGLATPLVPTRVIIICDGNLNAGLLVLCYAST